MEPNGVLAMDRGQARRPIPYVHEIDIADEPFHLLASEGYAQFLATLAKQNPIPVLARGNHEVLRLLRKIEIAVIAAGVTPLILAA
jgi:hypothetical protein